MAEKLKLKRNHFEEIILIGRCFVNGKEYKFLGISNDLRVHDVEFEDHILMQNVEVISQFFFDNCDFLKGLSLNDNTSSSLHFYKCSFIEEFSLNSFCKTLYIKECSFNKKCSIRAIYTQKIDFRDSNFFEALTFSGEIKDIEIVKLNFIYQEGRFPLRLTFRAIKVERLTISTCVCPEFEFLGTNTQLNYVHLGELTGNSLSLNNISISDKIDVWGCDIRHFSTNKITSQSKHRNINISENKFEHFIVTADDWDNFFMQVNYIKVLDILGNNADGSTLKFNDVTVDKCRFTGLFNKSNISVRNLILNKRNILEINNSDLGKTDFINCDFSKAILEFENSKITEIFSANTIFPQVVTLKDKQSHIQAQLAFGQLQTACQKQGDTVRQLEYHAREIEAHYKTLSFFSKDFFAKLSLGLNRVSSNFGRWWWLGVVFTFGVGFVGFYFLLASTDRYTMSIRGSIDWNLSDSFLKLMNPLRSFDTETLFIQHSDISVSEVSYYIDFLIRVLVAFGYYQTIQAFRKFGRK